MKDFERKAKTKYKAKIDELRVELYPTDQDIKDRLAERQAAGEPKATYIKRLVRQDIKQRSEQALQKEDLSETLAMEGPNQFKSVEYKPTCKFKNPDCIYDPAYIYATYPEWYAKLYGDKDPQEAAKEACTCCTEDHYRYDDEDK